MPIIVFWVVVFCAQDICSRRVSKPELHQYTIMINLGRVYLPTNAPEALFILIQRFWHGPENDTISALEIYTSSTDIHCVN